MYMEMLNQACLNHFVRLYIKENKLPRRNIKARSDGLQILPRNAYQVSGTFHLDVLFEG